MMSLYSLLLVLKDLLEGEAHLLLSVHWETKKSLIPLINGTLVLFQNGF